ncbi:hypothetical protein HMPREF9123_2869 [Neisseria bacilliformis ATCC BAA-1200]|uniref:Uncharacterized protein n=1 Tax=Neisseria bacilliformis ATCC BAA-1200 TaxID=888742 RepID=F2BGL2_9NEIS|nr:hypothetical protein HMPREF9123_2869 [Neisseria bacilliformis ATCC BAA-1200]
MCGASHARVPCHITNPHVSPTIKPRAWLRHTPYVGPADILRNANACPKQRFQTASAAKQKQEKDTA